MRCELEASGKRNRTQVAEGAEAEGGKTERETNERQAVVRREATEAKAAGVNTIAEADAAPETKAKPRCQREALRATLQRKKRNEC